jgi:transcriptional regulator with XRE-family HTH domain
MTTPTLAELRKRAGLTQMDLASKIGTTPAKVSGWESRGVTPSTKYLVALAAALGVTADELLEVLSANGQRQ